MQPDISNNDVWPKIFFLCIKDFQVEKVKGLRKKEFNPSDQFFWFLTFSFSEIFVWSRYLFHFCLKLHNLSFLSTVISYLSSQFLQPSSILFENSFCSSSSSKSLWKESSKKSSSSDSTEKKIYCITAISTWPPDYWIKRLFPPRVINF